MDSASVFHSLLSKWGKRHKELQEQLVEKHKEAFVNLGDNTKQIAIGSLGGILLLANPVHPLLTAGTNTSPSHITQTPQIDKKVFLISDLDKALPDRVRPLSPEEEKNISEILSRNFGLRVSAELEGKKLNRSYGLIGAEQHLMRYPGDTIDTHFDSPEEMALYKSSGMAPGRGAWGYFAYNRDTMTEEDKLREKYYIAVQTFLSPDFYNRVKEYVDFYKYRKMLVVNPQNGKAMVVVIGDVGPAEWTGKHLGGSPEVMKYLERVDGSRKGPVLYFFINDPENKVPLGPINII